MTSTPWFGLRGDYGDDPFTYELAPEVCGKLALLMEDVIQQSIDDQTSDRQLVPFVYDELKRAFGIPRIWGPGNSRNEYQNWIAEGDTKQCLRAVEVTLNCVFLTYTVGADGLKYQVDGAKAIARLIDDTNRLFRLHMCGYQIVKSPERPHLRVIKTDSFYMHESAIKEPLRLLSSVRLEPAEKQFFDAVREWSEGNYADAITDANSALEATMKFVSGRDTGTAQQLIKELLKQGYIPPYLQTSIEKLHQLFELLPRLRDAEGDAHGKLNEEELANHARLAIHLSGSFVVFLIEEWTRRTPPEADHTK